MRKHGSPFLIEPTVHILPEARKSLGEFKFMARSGWPREHVASVEGYLDDRIVYVVEFLDNLEYEAGGKIGGEVGPWIEVPTASTVKAKQAAAGRGRTYLGTIHSHPWKGKMTSDDATPSVYDHEDGHFNGEIISAIYSVTKNKNGRLYSSPIRWFIPQGRIKVVGL